MLKSLSDNSIIGDVIIESISLPNEITKKLSVIGLNVDSKIKVLENKNVKNIVIFEINNVKYGIRKKDASNIIVKKYN